VQVSDVRPAVTAGESAAAADPGVDLDVADVRRVDPGGEPGAGDAQRPHDPEARDGLRAGQAVHVGQVHELGPVAADEANPLQQGADVRPLLGTP
jgi:hypothetical protein